MFFGFLWPLGALKLCVCDVFETVRWYLILLDEMAGIGRIFDSTSYALEEPSNFVCS